MKSHHDNPVSTRIRSFPLPEICHNNYNPLTYACIVDGIPPPIVASFNQLKLVQLYKAILPIITSSTYTHISVPSQPLSSHRDQPCLGGHLPHICLQRVSPLLPLQGYSEPQFQRDINVFILLTWEHMHADKMQAGGEMWVRGRY